MRMVRRCAFLWILIGEKSENWLKVIGGYKYE